MMPYAEARSLRGQLELTDPSWDITMRTSLDLGLDLPITPISPDFRLGHRILADFVEHRYENQVIRGLRYGLDTRQTAIMQSRIQNHYEADTPRQAYERAQVNGIILPPLTRTNPPHKPVVVIQARGIIPHVNTETPFAARALTLMGLRSQGKTTKQAAEVVGIDRCRGTVCLREHTPQLTKNMNTGRLLAIQALDKLPPPPTIKEYGHGDLSQRMLQVGALAMIGLCNLDIAKTLDVEHETTRSHLKRLMATLHIRSRYEISSALLHTGRLVIRPPLHPKSTATPASPGERQG